MAYFRICPGCGANLDPDEKCDCKDQRGQEVQYLKKMIKTDLDTGQMSFKLDKKGNDEKRNITADSRS